MNMIIILDYKAKYNTFFIYSSHFLYFVEIYKNKLAFFSKKATSKRSLTANLHF